MLRGHARAGAESVRLPGRRRPAGRVPCGLSVSHAGTGTRCTRTGEAQVARLGPGGMKILLDESIDVRFRTRLAGHDVFTVSYTGWKSLKNGELVREAAAN